MPFPSALCQTLRMMQRQFEKDIIASPKELLHLGIRLHHGKVRAQAPGRALSSATPSSAARARQLCPSPDTML